LFGRCGEDLSEFVLTWPEVTLAKMTAYCACVEVVLHLHKALRLAYIHLVTTIDVEEAGAGKKGALQKLLEGIRESLRVAQESCTWLEYNKVLDPTIDRDVRALEIIHYLGQWIEETTSGNSDLLLELDGLAEFS